MSTEVKTLAAQATGPLKGVRIIDMTSVIFGAYATQMMGDLGADVIKIESPAPTGGGGQGGDIMRWAGKVPDGAEGLGPIFLALNRNKRSVELDLRKPTAVRALKRLIAGADVFATNVRYDGMKRLGLAYDDLVAIKPDIVYVHAAGYGADGPYAGQPAYDDLIQASSGLSDILPRMDGDPKPRYIPSAVADKTSGLFMTQALLAALFHRQRTGEGQLVEVPMLECVTSYLLTEHLYGRTFVPPTQQMGYSRVISPNRRPYRTKDGHIGLLPYSDSQWEQFFTLAGRPGAFSSDPRFSTYAARTQHINALYEMIEEMTQTKTTEEWLAVLKPHSIPVVRMNRLDDLADDPHLKAVEFFQLYDHPRAGRYVAMRPPLRFAKTPANITRHPPLLGEHNQEVLGVDGEDPAEA